MNHKNPVAISITGEWGIGKTYLWEKFYQYNREKFQIKHYAYVSLFGVKNLNDLKFEIVINSHEVKSDKTKSYKNLFKNAKLIDLPRIGFGGFSLNLGSDFSANLLSIIINDTLICIDDVERMSDDLDLKEVMGYLNNLKLKKDCKIIFILHEDKILDNNYREYQEKIFDDKLILDDNLSII